ncbi:dihydroorotase [Clostridium fermenticellae]|uniref:Dihydroorotase n=1 Tax=Clostridium fermenticellae TaxID=2068654 RepID=A0A386H1W0_9CLOT|nr:dihydroorotase [Clostridium fermenticellae]AYD39660.1 dihydroorotase [Clostridium fermenticellae]
MILIKNGCVIDPLSKINEKFDILIDGENIVKIDKNINKINNAKVIDASGCILAPGFIDIHSHFRDPGFTYKEDLLTGSKAAARGGYTTVVCMANTKPVVDNVDTLKYILDKARKAKIEVLQVATITKGMRGEELIDMHSLKEAGAVGFSDDGKPIMKSKVAFDSMKIAKELDVPLSFHEEDPNLIKENGINMGRIAKNLNLTGSPNEAEDVLVARDAVLAISTGAKVNIQHISSAVSVEILRWAKKMGANITAEVTPHHFSMTEKAVLEKGSNAKMNPPLRTEKDRKVIIEGIKDNILEIIATDHAPHTEEEKNNAFSKAPGGIIGLETALALSITNLVKPGYLTYMDLIEKLTINPAKLYNLDRGYIKEGHRADIVIFDPNEDYIVRDFASKACNSPFIGEKLSGRIKRTICKGKIVYMHER